MMGLARIRPPGMSKRRMIALKDLTKRYHNRAVVDRLSLEVGAGTIFGLLGPNGAGKTTTLAMLLHLVRPDGGNVTINGIDVWREPARALRMVGSLIEAPAFYPYLSAADNLRVIAEYASVSSVSVCFCEPAQQSAMIDSSVSPSSLVVRTSPALLSG